MVGIEDRELYNAIEALLFVSGDPVSIGKLAEALYIPVEDLIEFMPKMLDEYNFERRGIKLIKLEDSLKDAKRIAEQLELRYKAVEKAKSDLPILKDAYDKALKAFEKAKTDEPKFAELLEALKARGYKSHEEIQKRVEDRRRMLILFWRKYILLFHEKKFCRT